MKYFIIVDMQNDFVSGALKNDFAKDIIPSIVEKAKELKAAGYKIIATRDTHDENYMNTQEGKKLPVPHCLRGTYGWEVVDELKPFIDDYIDKKSFGFNNWAGYFSSEMEVPEEVVMCGTVTGICVTSNATLIKSEYPEIPIIVYKDLCAGLTEEDHYAAITTMAMQQVDIR